MAHKYNFIIEQGTVGGFSVQLWANEAKTVKFDSTGYKVRMKIRKHYNSATAVFDKDTSVVGQSGLTLSDDGLIGVRWEESESRNIPAGKYVAQIEVYKVDASDVRRAIESDPDGILVTPEVVK